jgi:hypothetical protein
MYDDLVQETVNIDIRSALRRFRPALEATMSSDGRPQGWSLFGAFANAAERDAFIARFPKSAGIKATTLSTTGAVFAAAAAQGNLRPNGVNDGINEAGLRRYRRIVEIAPELPWKTTFSNSYSSRKAFEEAVR